MKPQSVNSDRQQSTAPEASTAFGRREMLRSAAALAGSLAISADVSPAQTAPPPSERRRRFEGKVVVITGATSGIGRAAALAFAAEGGRVGFCGRREQLGREVEAAIRNAGGEAMYIRADVQRHDDVRAFIDATANQYGGLDVAFNNAGVSMMKPLHETSIEEWDTILNTNLRGVYLAMYYQIPYMLTRGGGTIVVTSSINAIASRMGLSAYTASKGALSSLVRAAVLDYGPRRIRINAVLPGTVDTPLARRLVGAENAPEEVWQAGAAEWGQARIPGAKRIANAEEIASFVLAVASNEHPFMHGSNLVIDGGQTSSLM